MWYFRGTQRNKWKPQEQLPILLNVIPDTRNGRDGKRSDLSMVRWLCNFNNICNSERQWVIISSTISPTLTNPGPYFMLGPKETLSKRGKRTLCKVSYSKFFPQVRKKHYLILEVYMHLGSSLIALKKKVAVSQYWTQQTCLILFRLLSELLAFTWHYVVLTGKAKYHSYIMVYRLSSQDILFPIWN